MSAPKRGDRFLHAFWLRPELSTREYAELPKAETAQPCKVTKVARGVVYYRPLYTHGTREEFGTPMYMAIGKFPLVVFRWL